jgi:hypothetical protein
MPVPDPLLDLDQLATNLDDAADDQEGRAAKWICRGYAKS